MANPEIVELGKGRMSDAPTCFYRQKFTTAKHFWSKYRTNLGGSSVNCDYKDILFKYASRKTGIKRTPWHLEVFYY